METSDAVTASRIILSPLFFGAFFLPKWTGLPWTVATIVLWVIFLVIEGSDFITAAQARMRGSQVDTGKLLDPFADSLTRLTYFLCFTLAGLMPVWIFLVLLYRDLAVGFVRFMVLRRGTSLTERLSGRFKTAAYSVAGVAGLLELTRMSFFEQWSHAQVLSTAMLVTFYVAGVAAVWSLVDYLTVLFSRSFRDT